MVTPIVTAASGLVAIVCVVLRLADRFPNWERFQWADLCVVISLVDKKSSWIHEAVADL